MIRNKLRWLIGLPPARVSFEPDPVIVPEEFFLEPQEPSPRPEFQLPHLKALSSRVKIFEGHVARAGPPDVPVGGFYALTEDGKDLQVPLVRLHWVDAHQDDPDSSAGYYIHGHIDDPEETTGNIVQLEADLVGKGSLSA